MREEAGARTEDSVSLTLVDSPTKSHTSTTFEGSLTSLGCPHSQGSSKSLTDAPMLPGEAD